MDVNEVFKELDVNGDGRVDNSTDNDNDGYADIYDSDNDDTAGDEDGDAWSLPLQEDPMGIRRQCHLGLQLSLRRLPGMVRKSSNRLGHVAIRRAIRSRRRTITSPPASRPRRRLSPRTSRRCIFFGPHCLRASGTIFDLGKKSAT